MRRKDKEVTDQAIIDRVLREAEVCRIALVDEGEPYLVPLSFGIQDNAIYVHSAKAGRKMDILRKNPRVCFEMEGHSSVVKHAEACHWGAKCRSVIGYGRVEILTNPEDKRRGLDIVMAHYGAQGPQTYDPKEVEAVAILKIQIESLSCKQLGKWAPGE